MPAFAMTARLASMFLSALLVGLGAAPAVAQSYVWDGGGGDNLWSTGANWVGDSAPVRSDTSFVTFAGSTRSLPFNDQGDWSRLAGMTFASGASGFRIEGANIGFYSASGDQVITQDSAATQEISNTFSFGPNQNSRIDLNAGDLLVTSPNVYIDLRGFDDFPILTITGVDTTRRTVTFSGTVNNSGSGTDPDIEILQNKRMLVTGTVTGGENFRTRIRDGVLEFGGAGTLQNGSVGLGRDEPAFNSSLFLNTGGATFSLPIELSPRSDSRMTIGGLNTSGTVTYTSEFSLDASSDNSAVDYVAAGGGTVEITANRDLGQLGVFVNRPNGPTGYGGTVVLSGSAYTTDDEGDPIPAPGSTALEAGTLQISDLNQIGTGQFEFNASSGDSGTLRYTGGSATTTRDLWIDNSGITRAAIDVSNGGTVLTWNPSGGNINQNFTKAGAGALVLGEQVTGGTVNVEAGLLILTQPNSYSGGTVVSGGTVEISGNYGSPGGSAAGLGTGNVSIDSGGQVNYWLSFSDSHTIANSFSLAGGTLYTNDGINTFSGQVTLSAGTSTISGKYEDPITLSGGLAGSGHVIFTQSGGTGAWPAPAFILSGTGSNTGTVRVSGASDLGATKLQLANVNALQSATLDMATGDAGTVEFTVAGNNTYFLGGLQGGRSLAFGGNSLSVGGNGQSTTYSGILSGGGGFTKVGSGNLILAGTSTYTGTTTVSAGRLSVNGGLGSSPVAVLAAAELGGSGSIGGAVSVANGGSLAPGNSIDSLGTGSVTFASGATFAAEVDSTNPLSLDSAADLLVVNGDLNLDAANGSLLSVTDLAGSPNPFIDSTTVFALINYSGAWNGGLFTYGADVLADGGTFTAGSQQWLIDYNSPTGGVNLTADYLPSSSFVTVTAVPEPAACIVALAGLACGGYLVSRRRKRA